MHAIFTRVTLASAGISCHCVLSIHLSVTSRCSTEMAKRRITQTTPHDSPVTLVFGCRKYRQKFKCGHPQWRCQMQVG